MHLNQTFDTAQNRAKASLRDNLYVNFRPIPLYRCGRGLSGVRVEKGQEAAPIPPLQKPSGSLRLNRRIKGNRPRIRKYPMGKDPRMHLKLEGSCRCGEVRFSADSQAPVPFMRCYCSICRRQRAVAVQSGISGSVSSVRVRDRQRTAQGLVERPHDARIEGKLGRTPLRSRRPMLRRISRGYAGGVAPGAEALDRLARWAAAASRWRPANDPAKSMVFCSSARRACLRYHWNERAILQPRSVRRLAWAGVDSNRARVARYCVSRDRWQPVRLGRAARPTTLWTGADVRFL